MADGESKLANQSARAEDRKSFSQFDQLASVAAGFSEIGNDTALLGVAATLR